MIKKTLDFKVLSVMLFNAWAFTLTFNLWMYCNPIYVVLTYLYNSIILIKPLFWNYLLILMLFETPIIFSSVEHKRKCLAECTACPFLFNGSEWWPMTYLGLFLTQSYHMSSEDLKLCTSWIDHCYDVFMVFFVHFGAWKL